MAPTPAAVPVTPAEVVERARRHLGKGVYKLGGGALFTSSSPFGPIGNPFEGTCDCSGFVAWACKYKRGPWNTDAMTHDARVGGAMFRLLGRHELVRPSDVIVYPGPDRDHDGERDAPGHCGIIVQVDEDFRRGQPEWWEDLRVVHCSPRRQAELGALRLSDATLWAARGWIIRPRNLEAAAQ